MNSIKILWADDEMDLLKPQLLYLREKGYEVIPVTNGQDAIDGCADNDIDIVFLDENMPGLSGLETLTVIKKARPGLPIVMITKNEAEDLMEEAIGSQITDYLIKPVKPQQILLTIKKIIDNKRLVKEKTNSAYQQEFQKIFARLQDDLDHKEWAELYQKLLFWELELDNSSAGEMKDVLSMQKSEANVQFSKFIAKRYTHWLNNPDDAPIMSHNVLKEKLFPIVGDGIPTLMILVDNLRYDQFKAIHPFIQENFRLEKEDHFYSILPTSTQYSRNAIFSGLLPSEIERRMPQFWKNDEEEGGKNLHEKDFLIDNLKRNRMDIKFIYNKITNHRDGRHLEDNITNYLNNDLSVIVYNFVDMLSHARTEMEVLKELASDESAYRSVTKSWFEHSPLRTALNRLSEKKVRLVITTDHGTIRVNQPSKVIGDRNTTTNLRYKNGKNLQFNKKDVLEVRNPQDAYLPKPHVSSSYIFAKEDTFFVYPNNYNYYVNYFKNTFQHGGISLEEMLIPFVVYTNR